ncbi:MAG TPA: hypothetical protein VJ970_00325, partial [Flavobacteriaceae bacterium]|nr:hypothetical protein [Flavobacteriaceae bacterium]
MLKLNSKSRIFLFVLTLVFTFITSTSEAQRKRNKKEKSGFELNEKMVNTLKFRSIGPAAYSGRISDIIVNPNNHSEYYVGTASGGLWKTTNHGTTFNPIFDDQSVFSIGCLAMDPNNPNVLWVGTGENNSQR